MLPSVGCHVDHDPTQTDLLEPITLAIFTLPQCKRNGYHTFVQHRMVLAGGIQLARHDNAPAAIATVVVLVIGGFSTDHLFRQGRGTAKAPRGKVLNLIASSLPIPYVDRLILVGAHHV